MKKLVISAVILAFAIVAQAGDNKASNAKDQSACCAAKAKTCQDTKVASTSSGKSCSAGGCCSKEAPAKQDLLSPKAAAELAKK